MGDIRSTRFYPANRPTLAVSKALALMGGKLPLAGAGEAILLAPLPDALAGALEAGVAELPFGARALAVRGAGRAV